MTAFKATTTIMGFDGDGDEYEHDLVLYATGTIYRENHGSPWGYETLVEIEEVNDYELDREPVTLQYLNDRFGEKQVSEVVDAALNHAEQDWD